MNLKSFSPSLPEGILLVFLPCIGISCSLRAPEPQSSDGAVVGQIIELMAAMPSPVGPTGSADGGASGAGSGDSAAEADAPGDSIQPLNFFADRLSVGDIVALNQSIEGGEEPGAEVAVPGGDMSPEFEKIFSIDDSISNYDYLSVASRESLNSRWKERISASVTQDFPVNVSRHEYAAISRLSEAPEAAPSAGHLLKRRRNLVLGITSGLEQVMHEELPEFLSEVSKNAATELMTDSNGIVSKTNYPRFRAKMAEELTSVKAQVAAGEPLYIIGKVGFADHIRVSYNRPPREVVEADIECLANAGKIIFEKHPDLTASSDVSIPQVELSRDPRIFWGFVAYQLMIDESGNLAANREMPLQLQTSEE